MVVRDRWRRCSRRTIRTSRTRRARLEAPSDAHPLGLDELGRDVLSRIVWGARVSLRVGFSVVILASLVGVTLGAISGYFGGIVDVSDHAPLRHPARVPRHPAGYRARGGARARVSTT